jgi:hypothetical protein
MREPGDAAKCSAMAASSPKTTVRSTLPPRPVFLVFLTVAYIRSSLRTLTGFIGWPALTVRGTGSK